MGTSREVIYSWITEERARQDRLFGGAENTLSIMPNGTQTQRVAVLAEEFGEVAHAVLEGDRFNLREELIQVAAVAVAWLEFGF